MKKFFQLFSLVSFLFISIPSLALETDWEGTKDEQGKARLIAGGYIAPDKILAGIEMQFKDNWHTYWKVPGDSGMPVTPDFNGSENVKNIEMLWPIPKRHLFYDLEGWIYGGRVILPVIIDVQDASKPVTLTANIKWAICDEDCLFAENKFTVEIPSDFKDESVTADISKFQAQVPVLKSKDVHLDNIEVSSNTIKASFSSTDKPFATDSDLFISEASKNFRFPKPEVKLSSDNKKIDFTSKYESLKKGEVLKGREINLVLTSGEQGYETNHTVTEITSSQDSPEPVLKPAPQEEVRETAPEAPVEVPNVSLFQAIIAALIGGLILNIMPCVLPVLSLKIFGIIKHGAADKKYIRASFTYTIAGIIFSFLLLAAFVLILKSAGKEVGWGIQFQNPIFLVFLSMLLTLFAANQWGLLEVALPYKLANKLNMTIDDAGDNSRLGNFLSGAFATLLATPCTAPYLVTAVSFAFTASSLKLMLVFIFMGIGLALPYIILLISPSLVKFLPKPGRWMKVVRIILGILLYLTNLWIFLIFFKNAGSNAAFVMLVCSALILIWLAVAHKFNLDRTKTFFTVIYMVVVTFGVTLYLSHIEVEPDFMKGAWVKFHESDIDKYVAKGKVVYVDVTADWCLTCQFNKARVLYPMKDYLDGRGVVLMKADYTVPDKEISDYLQKNKVFGIPFNKVYGPHAKSGIVLPVVLKAEDVKNAIDKAQ